VPFQRANADKGRGAVSVQPQEWSQEMHDPIGAVPPYGLPIERG
jgi:hypothetical protein